MAAHWIYVLKDPRLPDAVRYVGVTRQALAQRLSGHLALARKGGDWAVSRWIRKLLAEGIRPLAVVIESTEDRLREKYWIGCFLGQGMSLLNCSEATGSEVIWSAEMREKISAAHRGRKHSPEHCARLSAALKGHPATNRARGFHHSEETKQKLSAKCRGRIRPAEERARISASLKGKKKSPEHIQNAVAARQGFKHSAETKARLSEIRRGRPGVPKKRRQFCHKGHPFAGANLRIAKDGRQVCRACQAEWAREKYREQRAE